MRTTPPGKRIRRMIRTIELAADGVFDYNTMQIVMTDDLTLVGFRLALRTGYPDAPDMQEGVVDMGGHLTIGGYSGGPQTIANVSGRDMCVVEAAYSHFTSDQDALVQNTMFPEGYGIDFEENDIINLHVSGRQTILSAGTVTINCQVMLYFVER